MDNIPGRLEMFVMPFADMLDRMNNMSFSSPQVVVGFTNMNVVNIINIINIILHIDHSSIQRLLQFIG